MSAAASRPPVILDRAETAGTAAGAREVYESRELFERVRVNESQTVEWPGEVDLDPDVLYGRFEPASGDWIGRRTIREPARAA